MTTLNQNVWAAAYGAAFIRQVFDHMARGLGAPEEKTYADYAEEAAFLADEAVRLLDGVSKQY